VSENGKAAHLAMIQGVINRMGSNSLAVKTWTVGLVAALFAVGASGSPWLFIVAIFPAFVFCWLDAYYLRQERLFRDLYDAVRGDDERLKTAGLYSMSTKPFESAANVRWLSVFRSPAIWPFYGILLAITLACILLVGMR
jgi:protein-S-isoprenylcysteine O-methyltransferase Ste14